MSDDSCESQNPDLRFAKHYKRLIEETSTLTVYEPISPDELRTLADLTHQCWDDNEALQDIIYEWGSSLKIQADSIFLVHQSAKDFLLDPSNGTFALEKGKEHYLIFSSSLQAISKLERDIYKLEHPGVSIDETPSPDPLKGSASFVSFG